MVLSVPPEDARITAGIRRNSTSRPAPPQSASSADPATARPLPVPALHVTVETVNRLDRSRYRHSDTKLLIDPRRKTTIRIARSIGITKTGMVKPPMTTDFPRAALAVCALAFLAACSNPDTPNAILDPHEEQNRRVHAANIALDRTLAAPAANAYGNGVPRPVRRGVANFASNLSLPGKTVNNLLQLRIENALANTARFALNTTVGLGGILDPAAVMGIPERDTDFGETLYVWGVPEGNFIELPLLGPSTERHMIGRAVDLFTNPLSHATDGSGTVWATGTVKILSGVDKRYELSPTIEAILYESEDSYAQSRRIYLDNRRFRLGIGVSEEEANEIDELFEDFYGE